MEKDLTTLFTGRHLIHLEETSSTNSYLLESLKQRPLPEGAVVRSDNQKAGRGQAGSRWESDPNKNLLLSFLFYPSFISPQDIFLVNQSFSLGILDFARHHLPDPVTIKWPNDIYWKDQKVAGLLIENSIGTSGLSFSILGVGINVNQKVFSSYLANPTSFINITGKSFDLDELFNSLCSFLEARYLQLKRDGREGISEDYSASLFGLGVKQLFESKGETFLGRIVDVDKNGKLIVTAETGDAKVFDLKDIKYPIRS